MGTQSSNILPKVLRDPKTSHSRSPEESALTLSYGFKGTYFDFLKAPGNEEHLERFTVAMYSVATPDAALGGKLQHFVFI
jgi:hypothetical protein